MSLISIFFTLFFYFSVLIFITGLSYKAVQYWNTPAPLKIPIAPAPLTKSGVFLRLAKEVFLFATLFKSSKWTWLFGWSFHLALVLLFFRHLVYFWPGEIPLRGIPGYRARIRPIVSRITIHWPSFYNVVTGKTLALPNLIALQHIPLCQLA